MSSDGELWLLEKKEQSTAYIILCSSLHKYIKTLLNLFLHLVKKKQGITEWLKSEIQPKEENLPAMRASWQAKHMSAFISGFSSAIDCPTETNRSTAELTAWPTFSSACCCFSVSRGLSLWLTRVVIWEYKKVNFENSSQSQWNWYVYIHN